jgi:ribosome-associated protein
VRKLDVAVSAVLDLVHAAACRKLAREPVALDVREVTTITDVIYVCHGDSSRAVAAIAQGILDGLEGARKRAGHVEGLEAQQWVLIDLGSVMVHVFLRDRRDYYALEKLWHDARRVALPAA